MIKKRHTGRHDFVGGTPRLKIGPTPISFHDIEPHPVVGCERRSCIEKQECSTPAATVHNSFQANLNAVHSRNRTQQPGSAVAISVNKYSDCSTLILRHLPDDLTVGLVGSK